MIRWLALLAALLLTGAATADGVPVVPAEIVATYPHDRDAFTEGLFYRDGFLYESTGRVGQSSIRKVALTTGKVIRQVTVPPPYFGEGIVASGNQIISLTWQHHTGFRWSLDRFRKLGSFRYDGEGWALTSDGKRIIMSDGTPVLRFLDPVTLGETGRVTVTLNGRPIRYVNELEYVDGRILANIWHTNYVISIDPASGAIKGLIDLSAVAKSMGVSDPEAVANGIAWDAAGRRLFITGKEWPMIVQIKAPPVQ